MSSTDGVTTCSACGKEGGDSLKACMACKMVKYCNRDCQIAHRPQHKKACKKRAAELRMGDWSGSSSSSSKQSSATAASASMNTHEVNLRNILAEADAKRFPGDESLPDSLVNLVLSKVKKLEYEGKDKVDCSCGNSFQSKGENADMCNVCNVEKCIQCISPCETCEKSLCDDEDVCSKPCSFCQSSDSCTTCLGQKNGKLCCLECQHDDYWG